MVPVTILSYRCALLIRANSSAAVSVGLEGLFEDRGEAHCSVQRNKGLQIKVFYMICTCTLYFYPQQKNKYGEMILEH